MKLFKKCFFVSFVFIFIFARQTSAQSLPDLYLSKIILNESSYSPNSIVKGNFTLVNQNGNDAKDIYFLVSLVGLDESNHVTRVIYDTKKESPIEIAANTTQIIPFTYALNTIPDDPHLGIHIRAINKDGAPIHWAVTKLTTTGAISTLQPTFAYVSLNEKKYDLQQGPTVKMGDSVFLNAEYLNLSKDIYDVTPLIAVVDKSQNEVENIALAKEELVKIVPNGTSTISISLPVKDLKPGTYLARVSLMDSLGRNRAPNLFARYTVEGDVVDVQSIYSNNPFPLIINSTTTLSIGYTGRPIDITQFENASTTDISNVPVQATLHVKLFNENNVQVAEVSTSSIFNLTGFINVPISLIGDAKSLTAEISVLQGDITLSTYKGQVIYDAERVVDNFSSVENIKKSSYDIRLLYFIIGVILLLLVLGFFFTKKYYIAGIFLLILISLGIIFVVGIPDISRANTWHSDSAADLVTNRASGDLSRNIFTNIQGGPPTSVNTNESYDINTTFYMDACYNATMVANATVRVKDASNQWQIINVSTSTLRTFNSAAFQYYVDFLAQNAYSVSSYNQYGDMYLGTHTAPSYAVNNYDFLTTFEDIFYNYGSSKGHNVGHEVGHWYMNVIAPTSASGSCNYSVAKTYPSNYTTFASGDFCLSGDPSPVTPVFPTNPGSSVSWTCNSLDTDGVSPTCTAIRSCPNGTNNPPDCNRCTSPFVWNNQTLKCEMNDCIGPDGSIIANGTSKLYYASEYSKDCGLAQTRQCTNGILSGSEKYSSCSSGYDDLGIIDVFKTQQKSVLLNKGETCYIDWKLKENAYNVLEDLSCIVNPSETDLILDTISGIFNFPNIQTTTTYTMSCSGKTGTETITDSKTAKCVINPGVIEI
jgi:hypothetical protein